MSSILGNKVPERSSNTEQERYADGLVPTVISPHQWTMMIQQRLVDPGRTPLSQGWRVFDDLASMPRGNITTRWGITTSEVAGNDLESVDQLESDQVSAPVNTSDAAATASSDAISTSFTMARASQRGFASTKKWTEGEIRHLVGLRAQRVPYQVIATSHLRRGVKSCQLKFDRIKRESPYRDMLRNSGAEDHEGSDQEGGSVERDSIKNDAGEDDEDVPEEA